jgi:hypothetical protein
MAPRTRRCPSRPDAAPIARALWGRIITKLDKRQVVAEYKRTRAKVAQNLAKVQGFASGSIKSEIEAAAAQRAASSANATQESLELALEDWAEQPRRAASVPRGGDDHDELIRQAKRMLGDGEPKRGLPKKLAERRSSFSLSESQIRRVLRAAGIWP